MNCVSHAAGSAPFAEHEPMHAFELAGAARDHGQLGFEAFKIELTDHAVMSLLDQKHSRTWFKLVSDELEFSFAQSESLRVLLETRRRRSGKNTLVGVCSTKVRLMGLSSTSLGLCVARHITRVEFSPGLRAVFRETLEGGIGQQPPELIHPAHEATSVEQLAHQMKQVQGDRRTRQASGREIPSRRTPMSERPANRDTTVIARIIEDPGVVAAT